MVGTGARKWGAYVESQLEEHGKGVRLKRGAFDSPLEDDVLRGVAARLYKTTLPGGEGTAELDLREIELPPDTPEGRMYADTERIFEEAKKRLTEHTRHVIHLHADLLILNTESLRACRESSWRVITLRAEHVRLGKRDMRDGPEREGKTRNSLYALPPYFHFTPLSRKHARGMDARTKTPLCSISP